MRNRVIPRLIGHGGEQTVGNGRIIEKSGGLMAYERVIAAGLVVESGVWRLRRQAVGRCI